MNICMRFYLYIHALIYIYIEHAYSFSINVPILFSAMANAIFREIYLVHFELYL